MADFVLALDQGTSSSRAILFDHSGAIRSTAQREFKQHYPHPGWVEHDPEEIWETQLDTAREALKSAGAHFHDVAAIGITNQRETTVVWDKAGRPVHNAIVWQDRRTAAFCDELKAMGLEPVFRDKTGLLIDPYFSGTKVRWLLDHADGARSKAAKGELLFGTIDSWLLYRLCGVHATDYTNASRTLLYNIFERQWDPDLLSALDIPDSLLPAVQPSSGVFGETNLLGGRLPVAGDAGDQQAALFGQAAFSPGMAKNTYGTGAFLLMNVGDKPVHSSSMLTTIAWGLPTSPSVIPPPSTVIPSGAQDAAGDRSAARDPRDDTPPQNNATSPNDTPPENNATSQTDRVTYALEGSIFIAGAAVQWLRDELQVIADAAESSALASSVPDSNGVYVVPAFVGLGAPHWDPNARGAILGLTRGANRAHIVRATLEAIAFQVRDVVEAMERDSGTKLAELRVDGGAAANDLLLQMQADTLGRDVVRPAVLETTALGAAYLAGLAVGFWKDPADVAGNWREDRRFTPQMPADKREALYAGWLGAVERSKAWATD